MNAAPAYFYDKSQLKLWIGFRTIQALWILEPIIHFFLSDNAHAWQTLWTLQFLELVVSLVVFVATLIPCLEPKMTAFFSGWSVFSALYHLFLIGVGRNAAEGGSISWRVVSMFILPLWSSLHRIPIHILWGQQIITFCLVFSVQMHSHRIETDLELKTLFGFFTILGMFIVYTQEAAGCSLSKSVKNYKVDLENISSLVIQQDTQMKEERNMTLYISHEIRNPLFNINNALEFFDQCLDSLENLPNSIELPSTIHAM